jgi:hypothetical protein
VLWLIILTGVLPAFIPVFIFVGPMLFKFAANRSGSMPTTCNMNETLEIENQTFSGSGTLIEAGLNCKLKIKNSKLSGDIVVDSKGNLDLTVENSTLEGKDVALKLDFNAKVNLTKGSVLKSPELAVAGATNTEIRLDGSSIEAGSHGVELGVNGKVWLSRKSKATSDGSTIHGETNLEVTVDDSEIDSKDVAIAGNLNTKFKFVRGAKVHGARTAVRTAGNMRMTLENATVASEGTAICSAYNADIVASRSIISGGVEAVRLERKPNQFDLRDTSLRGIKNFEASGCGGGEVDTAAATPEAPVDPRAILKNAMKEVARVRAKAAGAAPIPTPTPAPAPAVPPPFDTGAAASALDAAARSASANCRSSQGKPMSIFVNPGFTPDGANRGAVPSNAALANTPEGVCVLGIFRRVRIPPFDPKTLPGGMGRNVNLR